MVKKYQKKPVVIEAIQFNGLNPIEIKDFVGDKCEIEYIGEEAHKLGQAPMAARITIHTLEGDMNVSVNDYVIKGVKGEFYPCKPDIFLDTYNPMSSSVGASSQKMPPLPDSLVSQQAKDSYSQLLQTL